MSDHWRRFASQLTELAKSEGHDQFLSQAFMFLNQYVVVDSCAVFKVSADKTTGAQHLCTFGQLEADLADLLAEDYAANGFKNDPMVKTALLSPRVKVRRLPPSRYSPAYRSQYFGKAKLIDKVTSIHSSKNVLFLVSFYRVEGHGVFSKDDFKDLERLAPIIGRFVLRHTRLNQRDPHVKDDFEQRIAQLVEDSTQIFSKLSQREREICKHILLGDKEKDIGEHLGVALNTVITYRRRLYAKLNISSKDELYRIAFMSQKPTFA